MKRRHRRGREKYRSTNSRPAARAGTASPSSEPRSLPPPPFAFDHATQSLTARWAAKFLAWTAKGAYKPLVATWTFAAEEFKVPCWALALAGLCRTDVGGFWPERKRWLGLSGLPTFCAATSIPLALSLPFLPAIGGLSILPVGTTSPPSPSRGPASGTAISGLGMGGMKRLLTSLEQTRSLTRPSSPLTGARFAASWWWAQGSCELPTAKPRMRSPYLRSEATSLINSSLVGVRHPHLKANTV
jgi:hypothetical protein